MGNSKSAHKGSDLAVGSYALGETAQRASGVANGPDGNILVAHSTRIVAVNPKSGEVSNWAGKHHVGGYADGHRSNGALFQKVSDLVMIDQAIYVVDCDNCRIRVVENDQVSTYAGTGKQLIQDGPRKEAAFFYPQSIAVLASKMYLTDLGAGLIRIIDSDGMVSTLRNLPGESLWRWKVHANDGGSKSTAAEKSPLKDSSGSSSQKTLSTSSSDAFEGPHEFEDDGEGRLKFGILKDVTTSVVSGVKKVFYVADEVKAVEQSTGVVVNVSRVMRFDVEKREVESIVVSKSKPLNPISPQSLGKLPSTVSINLHGGRDLIKDGPIITGLCAVSLNSSHDACLLISDASKHSIWRAHIKHTGHVSLASVVGKEDGFKDGSLKSAKLSSPDSLHIASPSGDLYWIDGALESPEGKLREVKGFEKSVQIMYRAEMGANISGSSTPTKLHSDIGASTTPKSAASTTGSIGGEREGANQEGDPSARQRSPLFSSQPSSPASHIASSAANVTTSHQSLSSSSASILVPSSSSTPQSKSIPIDDTMSHKNVPSHDNNHHNITSNQTSLQSNRLSASAPIAPSHILIRTTAAIQEEKEAPESARECVTGSVASDPPSSSGPFAASYGGAASSYGGAACGAASSDASAGAALMSSSSSSSNLNAHHQSHWKTGSSSNLLWKNVEAGGGNHSTSQQLSSSSHIPPLSSPLHPTHQAAASPPSPASPSGGRGGGWSVSPSSSQTHLATSPTSSSPSSPLSPESERLAMHRSHRSPPIEGSNNYNHHAASAPPTAPATKESVPLSQGFVFIGGGGGGNGPTSNGISSNETSTMSSSHLPAHQQQQQQQHPHSAPLLSSSSHTATAPISSAPSSDATHSTHSSGVPSSPAEAPSSAPTPLLTSSLSSAHSHKPQESVNFRIAISQPPLSSPSSPWSVSIPPDFSSEAPSPSLYDDWTVINDSTTPSS